MGCFALATNNNIFIVSQTKLTKNHFTSILLSRIPFEYKQKSNRTNGICQFTTKQIKRKGRKKIGKILINL